MIVPRSIFVMLKPHIILLDSMLKKYMLKVRHEIPITVYCYFRNLGYSKINIPTMKSEIEDRYYAHIDKTNKIECPL